ncbi:MAG: hypothetical protein LBT25_12965 [Candidatus Symbiothrix sp.]|nr:hypothetical protein [Candidatus Symbiothrix sp.]
MQIRIVASKATVVKGTFTAESSLDFSISIKEGEVYTRDLSMAEKTAIYAPRSGTTNNSLHLQSDEPVSVYAMTQVAASADATNILPTNNLGTDYYHISYKPRFNNEEYVAVVTENGTDIYENGVSIESDLQAGQVVAVYYEQGDRTGTHVTSNKPIAYFVATEGALIPAGVNSSDCLSQQMMPVHTWGKKFLVPVSAQGVTRIRVVAAQDGTTLTVSGGDIQSGLGESSLNLNKGQFVELESITAQKGCFIESDKPVGLVSFLVGIDHVQTSSKGDPALAWIPPLEQALPSISIAPFIPSGNTNLLEHYAMIITETASRDKTTVSLGGDPPIDLSGANWITSHDIYSYCSLQLTDSTKAYVFENPAGLLILGYGLGPAESYYYLAGSAARNLNANFFMNDISYLDIDGQEFCNIQSFKIRSEISYALDTAAGYLTWWIDGTEQQQATDQEEWEWDQNLTPGEHTITMKIRDISLQEYEFSTHIKLCATSYKIPVNPQIKAGN